MFKRLTIVASLSMLVLGGSGLAKHVEARGHRLTCPNTNCKNAHECEFLEGSRCSFQTEFACHVADCVIE